MTDQFSPSSPNGTHGTEVVSEVQSLRLQECSDGAGGWELIAAEVALPSEVQRRLEVIQKLLAVRGTDRYGKVQQSAARTLGITVRSVQRLMKTWQSQGVAGLLKQQRRDRGAFKTSADWQNFIVKTYREGNRGSRRMSPAQVAVRVKVRAEELATKDYPSRTTVYRILREQIEKRQQQKRSIGWRGERLRLKTREGLEIPIEWSNQVWQCDHTRVDVLVVDSGGEILERPWLTIVVDTYSRCIMGMHLGMDAPSASIVCLALRHAILPKQYSGAYQLQQLWGTYGLPQYLYTDGGRDFRSQHIEQVATELGIVLCLRRKPSDGGIVERPFGTFNTELFSTLPGYVGSNVTKRPKSTQTEARLTLLQLEQILVRYIVDNYNPKVDARMGNQSRIGRWEAGRVAQLPLLGERELDICLMRRDKRSVYRGGYIQLANLTYQGEHLAAYAGESVVVRYDPRDITTVWLYQIRDGKEVFLTRAHAQGWEAETLSLAEAIAMARRVRKQGKAIDNRSLLNEVRSRDAAVEKLQRQAKRKGNALDIEKQAGVEPKVEPKQLQRQVSSLPVDLPNTEQAKTEKVKPRKPVAPVEVLDYEELKRQAGFL